MTGRGHRSTRTTTQPADQPIELVETVAAPARATRTARRRGAAETEPAAESTVATVVEAPDAFAAPDLDEAATSADLVRV